MDIENIKVLGDKIRENISKVIVGKDDVIDLVLVSLFSSGHVLLEDVPGTGKTMLAKCLAKSISCDFKRVQFTPDLLPSDLTGINFYNQKEGEFVFRPGPVFTCIVLADEINRATPRTQASLLESMEERQVTIDGDTKKLKEPFFVIATQNPLETQGTFPLPEAQLDRFLMRLKIGYPSITEGREILDRFESGSTYPTVTEVACTEDIVEVQKAVTAVKVGGAVKEYIMSLTEATRKNEKIVLGVSPRGSISLMKACQAYAAIHNRNFATPDDVKAVAVPVLAHRLMLKGYGFSGGTKQAEAVMNEILASVPVPTEEL